ncbi:uncharacterized protein PHACADRAFT_167770 [Phanerochaete carnosa HHB-10118-sp]|uniref:Calpain catalytic domain-containing protein n=1 Tax=Phanerochaete carnosa (strain HHB-10118-sp) TaxID=650164 RepID=K5W904_PHACS|nr:uncharacterized protein PHACADRAFT_167770 [Phanerochaete carnosa HHB-10118-sp]EKM60408.1 hypothetical protein PHACADRAFT_167770 [Phanerochaete carnosa HHB-10118-sp]
MCISTGQKREIWPALLEKAYMKLMGGYEFPGSLSSTDLYTLVGWIPEHVDIASPHFEREKTWSRLSSAFLEGRCMLTLGTGSELRNGAVETMALLPAHSYAVIDITDNEDDRTLVILDPWKDSAAPPDIDTQTAQEMIKLSLDDSGNDTSRIFRVPWDTVCTVFDGVYLSWDPKIFSHQLSFHGAWRKDASTQGALRMHTRSTVDIILTSALASHIQLGLRVSRDELGTRETEVWLLLTRHVVDTKRSGEFISFSVHDQGSTSLEVLKGEYTNNTQVLVRVLVSDPSLSLVASYDGPYDDVGFTVMVYSSFPVSWNTEMNVLAYSEKVAGAFTSKNAGGNPSLPSFMVNPQYHLRIHADYTAPRAGRGKKVQIKLSLQGERRIPLNILAIWSQGQRVTDFAQSDVAISSGAYTYGHAFATKEVLAGDYTMVVSAFDNRHLGTFAFNIDCSTRFDLKPIPQEGAGMFSKVIRGEWTTETAAGAPKFERYKHNPIHELKLPSQSQVLIRLQLANPGIIISLNVTLFLLTSAKSLGSLVATSGPYADSVCGVVLGPITAQAGSYAIVPSTFNPGVCTSFRLLVFTSSSGTSIASVTVCR